MTDPVSDSDHQLLARYARDHVEAAFAELVRRHVNLVHSAALRQVRSPQLVEEVAQSVFTDLARNAAKLTTAPDPTPVLTAWLYQVTRRTAIDVVRREARRQLRDQIAIDLNAMNATAADWTNIEPLLDEAMTALDETDRTAVLLRYFENKSLREVGVALGTSDDAAQKRVSRAVERLREFFAKRGVTVGTSGLAVVISANAVQAAPVGLALTISTAAVLTGTTLATTATTATAIKTVAMTTLQKTVITATLAVVAGVGIFEARQATQLKEQNVTLQQQHAPLANQVEGLNQALKDATNRLAEMSNEMQRLHQNTSDLLRLRAEVTRLRNDALAFKQAENSNSSEQDMQVFFLPVHSNLDFPGLVQGVAPWNQVMLSGGWKTPSGNRAVLFALPQKPNAKDSTQVRISGRIVEFPESAASALGLEEFLVESPESHDPRVLTPEKYESILKAAKTTEGVVTVNLGSLETKSGQQMQLSNFEQSTERDGFREGPVIDILPEVSSDGQAVELRIVATFRTPLTPLMVPVQGRVI